METIYLCDCWDLVHWHGPTGHAGGLLVNGFEDFIADVLGCGEAGLFVNAVRPWDLGNAGSLGLFVPLPDNRLYRHPVAEFVFVLGPQLLVMVTLVLIIEGPFVLAKKVGPYLKQYQLDN